MERTILYATDLSGDDAAGLRHASALARDRNATLAIAHVIEIVAADGEPLLLQTLRLDSAVLWRRLRKLVPPDLSVPYRHLLETGDPERVICELARRERAELLVLEARRRSPLRSLFGADLLERLLRSAPCPVVGFRSSQASEETGRSPAGSAAPAEPLAVLRTTLQAKVTALELWFDAQLATARSVAARASLREPIARLLQHARGQAPGEAEKAVGAEMKPLLDALGCPGFLLFDAEGEVRAAGLDPACAPEGDEERRAFVRRVLEQGPAVSRPFALKVDAGGRERSVLLAAAPVPLGEGGPPAVLALCVDAERDFLRILSIPGPGETTETYAFDPSGLMLSYSRFPEQLRRVGLLQRHSREQTALRLRVCDPGGNLLTGFRPGVAPELLPLTRMAERAISGIDGFDLTGYRDYRGVDVVGVWTWLEQHQFGVAAEMDVSEAF